METPWIDRAETSKPPVIGAARFRGFPGAKTFWLRLRATRVSTSGALLRTVMTSLPTTRFTDGSRRVSMA